MEKIQITLAAARVNAGLTQDDVAKKLHISKNTVVSWEKGDTEPEISQARELSTLFNFLYRKYFFCFFVLNTPEHVR